MADEFDFSELRNYLSGQIDLGEAELLLDEPWTLTRKPAVSTATAARPAAPVAPRPVPPTPTAAPAARPVPRNLPPQFPNSSAAAPADAPQAPIPDTTGFAPSLFGAVDSKATTISAANMPTERIVKRTASAFESVDSLDAFYESIKGEAMYAKEAALARYVGPAKPKVLFLLPAIKMAEAANISATNTKDEYKTAARRLPLSTLRRAGLQVDGRGRLVGIKDAMDEANGRYVMSEEQAKVGTNLKQMEDERVKRRIEQGQKILQEEEEEANQEQEEIVYSNKLTDEEKRKYGSTRDLQAPEAFEDENTQEAEETLYNGDYDNP